MFHRQMAEAKGVEYMMKNGARLVSVVLLTAASGWGCGASKPYTVAEATRHGDVVVGPGVQGVGNMSALTIFLSNINHHKKASVRITSFTDEGDPIFVDLSFNGQTIEYTYDDSEDRFGGQQRGRKTTTCTGIATRSVTNGTEYVLSGCQDTSMPSEVLFVPFVGR
jgi:hypothetical protein